MKRHNHAHPPPHTLASSNCSAKFSFRTDWQADKLYTRIYWRCSAFVVGPRTGAARHRIRYAVVQRDPAVWRCAVEQHAVECTTTDQYNKLMPELGHFGTHGDLIISTITPPVRKQDRMLLLLLQEMRTGCVCVCECLEHHGAVRFLARVLDERLRRSTATALSTSAICLKFSLQFVPQAVSAYK